MTRELAILLLPTAQVAISEDSEHQTFFCFTRLCDGKCALLGSSLWSTRRNIESVFVTSVHSWVSSRSVVGCKKSVWCITYIYIYIHNLTHVQAEYSCLHFWHVLTNKNLSWSLKRATKRWNFSRVASFVMRAPWGDLWVICCRLTACHHNLIVATWSQALWGTAGPPKRSPKTGGEVGRAQGIGDQVNQILLLNKCRNPSKTGKAPGNDISPRIIPKDHPHAGQFEGEAFKLAVADSDLWFSILFL